MTGGLSYLLKFSVLVRFLICFLTLTPCYSQFITKWQANTLSKNCYQITQDKQLHAGAIWNEQKLDLTKTVELSYSLYFGTKDQVGADGMAFVMHNDPSGVDAKGEVGEGLLYGDVAGFAGSKKIINSVAIEFDTYRNTYPACSPTPDKADPFFDHTTVAYNGDPCNPLFVPVQIHAEKFDVEDNNSYLIKIKWIPGGESEMDELTLYVDGVLRFTHKDFMVKNIFNTSSVYFGFTGTTGGLYNEQVVTLVEGNSIPNAIDDFVRTTQDVQLEIDVLANDYDADESPVYTSFVIDSPLNGTATILAHSKILYIPNPGFGGKDSLRYRICDVPFSGSDKPYGNCSNAWIKINVECTAGLIDKSVSVEFDSLFANADTATYQWINCHDNLPIEGASNRCFRPGKSGNYAVLINKNGCSVQSECYELNVIGAYPEILSFTPNRGFAGDTILISGSHFYEIISVQLNGIEADFTILSSDLISLILPENSTSGKISIETHKGTFVSSGEIFVETLINSPYNLVAERNQSTVNLRWEDKSDNEEGFIVERFLDNERQFVQIAILKANDTSFQDTITSDRETEYYRVYGYRKNLNSEYSNIANAVLSPVTGIEDVTLSSIEIFPNPSHGTFGIRLKNPEAADVSITVSDLTGNIVLTKRLDPRTLKDTLEFDLRVPVKGIYMLKITAGPKTLNKKLITN